MNITLTQVQERLCAKITGEFIEHELKVPPAERQKRSVFWREDQFSTICDNFIIHINAVKGGKRIAPKVKAPAADASLDDLF